MYIFKNVHSPDGRIWGKNLALEPNPYPQKGGEKVLKTVYKIKIKRVLTLY